MRADARKNRDHILSIAGQVFADRGADASLRDVARRASVGLGTLYRHFPTRESLLEALLRASFDALTARAADLETSGPRDHALVSWLREAVAVAHKQRGVVASMMTAIADPDSALHVSCVTMRAAGMRLLARAQEERLARADIDGTDLFALVGALAWLNDQPSLSARADHLLDIIAGAILTGTPRSAGEDGSPAAVSGRR